MKKILVVASFPAPYRVEVFKGLAQKYDITVFFNTNTDQNRNADWFCKDIDLNSYNISNEEGKAAYKNALRNIESYDLVLAYDYYLFNAMKAQLLCIIKKIPYIINLDGAFIKKNSIKNIVKRFFVTNASGFFASGNCAKDYFLYFGADENKIFMHPFTSLKQSDIYETPANKTEKRQLRKELEIKDIPTIVSIGQFIHRKGFDIILEAWKELDKSKQLLIIGGGIEGEKYNQIIEENGYNNVKIIGFKPKEEVFKYYRAADLFVLSTREDIWGLVVNESMACGIPVITTNRCVAGIELIENGLNGYIVNVGNVKDLVEAIDNVFASDIEKIGHNNIGKIKNYTIEKVVEQHVKAIESVINEC